MKKTGDADLFFNLIWINEAGKTVHAGSGTGDMSAAGLG